MMINEKDGSELVLISAGPFLAGDDKHEETLPDFYLGKFAVTNRQYVMFLNSPDVPRWIDFDQWFSLKDSSLEVRDGKYAVVSGTEGYPMTGLNWCGAAAYCGWSGLRLPTELEWEKGARGTDGRVYPWGNEWDVNKCRHGGNREVEKTCVVTAYPEGVSPYGLLNMVGNVWEWCADRYSESSTARVVRGGSWSSDLTDNFRCACRNNSLPFAQRDIIGFRVARDA